MSLASVTGVVVDGARGPGGRARRQKMKFRKRQRREGTCGEQRNRKRCLTPSSWLWRCLWFGLAIRWGTSWERILPVCFAGVAGHEDRVLFTWHRHPQFLVASTRFSLMTTPCPFLFCKVFLPSVSFLFSLLINSPWNCWKNFSPRLPAFITSCAFPTRLILLKNRSELLKALCYSKVSACSPLPIK